MRPVQLLAIAIVVGSSVAPRVSAQGAPGAMVRVSHDSPCCRSPLTGALLFATADSLWIRPEGASSSAALVALSRRSVRTFERGQVVGAHRVAGAALGLLAGTVVGGVIGGSDRCQCDGAQAIAQISGAVAGGLVGILSGVVLGSFVPHYEWQREDVPRRVGASVGPAGSVRAGGSLHF